MLFLDALNLFYEELDSLLIAHNTVMDNALKCYRKSKASVERWVLLRNAKYIRLQTLFSELEKKYIKIDEAFQGMTRRLSFVDMIKDLKSMPPEYFKKVQRKSVALEHKFINVMGY
jgi:hypothetical protein